MATAVQKEAAGGRVLKTKVLLVEDSRLLRITSERALVKAGYEVICAADGEQALRVVHDKMPDLILLDRYCPKWRGLACCDC